MSKKQFNPNDKDMFKLTTEEAIKLIDMLKKKVSNTILNFPKSGEKIEFDVSAVKDATRFIINISRGNVNNKKCTYQGRTYINSTPLLRLDVTNSFHINPDGTKIQGTHLHIYDEEDEMRKAIPFNIESPDLYEYCLAFFKEFNLLEDSCPIAYQTEIQEGGQ